MSFKKEDQTKQNVEGDSKAIPRFSTQLSDSRKISNDTTSKTDVPIPRFSQYSEYKPKSNADNIPKKVDLSSYKIGYGTLTEQMRKRAFRKGFEFNVMIVGCSGLGKSTFVNSLLVSDFYNAENLGPSKRIKKTVYVEPNTVILKEKDVVLKLCLIDTPGFGDAVDNSSCWDPILDYIDAKYSEYMDCESKVNRGIFSDKRVHACLYFIQSTGHSLKALDIEFMKRIHEKVNIIPVIAKADTLTPEECRDFKKNISNQLTFHKIKVYDFPETLSTLLSSFKNLGFTDESEDNDDILNIKKCREKIPFAVVGSNIVIDKNGKKIRGRRYPWGDVEVENIEHNDFLYLKHLLLRTHLQDLKDVTNQQLYEKYRSTKLAKIAEDSNFTVTDGKDPMSQLEAEKHEQENRIRKMEDEMRVLFEQKAEERASKLKETETEMDKRREHMKIQLESQTKEYDELKKRFEIEKQQWEEAHRDWDLEYDTRSSSERLESKATKSKRKTLF